MDKIAILTDLGNVLMKSGVRTETLLRLVAFLKGDVEEAKRLLQSGESLVDHDGPYRAVDRGTMSFKHFLEILFSETKAQRGEISYELLCALYLRPLEPLYEVIEVYWSLQDRFPLVAVSNGDLGSRFMVLDLEMNHGLRFTNSFISSEKGDEKPELFLQVEDWLKQEGFEPRKCPFVDDKLKHVVAARDDHGFPGIHFNGRTMRASLLRSELAKLGVQ